MGERQASVGFLSGRAAPWLSSPNIHFLRGGFDMELLRQRLLAWCWQQQSLCPCLFGKAAFDIINGAMSLYRSADSPPHLFPLEVSVKPVEASGGDVVLRADLPDRTLLILADASGHGQGSVLTRRCWCWARRAACCLKPCRRRRWRS